MKRVPEKRQENGEAKKSMCINKTEFIWPKFVKENKYKIAYLVGTPCAVMQINS